MGPAVELVALLLLLDIARRIYRARDAFAHRQAYGAWMTFVVCSISTLAAEAINATQLLNGVFESIAIGLRFAAVTSLWAAMIISMPGAVGRRVLEASRLGVKGPKTIVPLHPKEPATHEQSTHSQSA